MFKIYVGRKLYNRNRSVLRYRMKNVPYKFCDMLLFKNFQWNHNRAEFKSGPGGGFRTRSNI